jgi:PBP1b-binding outer membrane lipoprotein LpoB
MLMDTRRRVGVVAAVLATAILLSGCASSPKPAAEATMTPGAQPANPLGGTDARINPLAPANAARAAAGAASQQNQQEQKNVDNAGN